MANLQGFLSRTGPRGISGGQSGKVTGVSVPGCSAWHFWWAEWQSYRVFCPGLVRVVFLVGRVAKLQGFLSQTGPRGISGGQNGKVTGVSVPDWSVWYFWWAE